MDNPFILLGILIFFSFFYLDKVLEKWKKEHDEKLDDIKNAIEDLRASFDEQFSNDDETGYGI